MQFILEQARIGGDRNFGYLIGDRKAKTAALVDPAYTPETLVERAKAQGLKVTHILNTHSHGDHTNGNGKAKELTGAPLVAFEGSPVAPDISLRDGGALELGAFTLRCVHTPGHCADHLVVWVEQASAAITGDLLFVGKVGGTGTDEDARVEWESLRKILNLLPDATTVWPGHDYGCRPASTVGLEKRTNPFLQCQDLDAFLSLKREWPAFKQRHGLK